MTTPSHLSCSPLRELLGAPFPSALVAAPRSRGAAWVLNERGCRNLWVDDGGTGSRALTHYRGDDGHLLRQLCWLPGGDGLVYVRGALPGEEEPPFPARAPAGVDVPRIWHVALDGAAPRLLCTGQSPAVSPAGDQVAYLVAGQVWRVLLASPGVPEPLVDDGGVCGALAWSPDGARLAFTSDRGGRAFVGVVTLADRSLRWIAPGVDRDASPTWSPDGQRIAFVRMADTGAPTYASRPTGSPWSLWIGDVATGAAHCAWTARPGAGSVFSALPSGPQLAWTADGRVVFPWEGSGWRHLHAVSAELRVHGAGAADGAGGDGGEDVGGAGRFAARDLTPGDFEVFGMAITPARDALAYAANQGDLDARHLWRVDLASGVTSALTAGRGIEDQAVVDAAGNVYALHSDARTPLHPVRIVPGAPMRALVLPRGAGSGDRGREVDPGSGPGIGPGLHPLHAAYVEPRVVVFASADGVEIHAQLFLPPDAGARGRLPAVVHFHGGPARQMLPAWHPLDAYHHQYAFNQYLASRGFAVLSVNYRGGTGYGLSFREPPDFGTAGASEFQDALAAAHYLRGRADIDAARIGAYGFSYGGLMTGLALARASNLFAAGVDGAGISDWSPLFAGAPASVAETAFAASPMANVDTWRSPVLFIHADDDRTVPFDQTVRIAKALRRRPGVEVEHLVIPDEQHDFLRHGTWEQVLAATADFLERKLT